MHPHDAAAVTAQEWDELARLAADPRVVAIGETGLDYYRDRAPRDRQAELFVRHIALARALGKPLVVHSRDAAADTFAILERERAGEIGGVLHCFSGTREDGERALALGFFALARRSADLPALRAARGRARAADRADGGRDRRPVPRPPGAAAAGATSRPSSPRPRRALAAIKGLAERDVRRITTRNACALFRLPCPPAAPEIAYPIRNSLYLNVTSRCSNRCTFCTRESSPIVKGHDLHLEREPTAREVLAAAGDVAGYDEVVFCGFGEPLLRWDVVREVAQGLKARGARVRINTNGQSRLFLGRDILPEMAGVVDALSVSLNAPDAAALREDLPPGRRGAGLRGRQGVHPRGASLRAERHGERRRAARRRCRGLPAHRRAGTRRRVPGPPLQRSRLAGRRRTMIDCLKTSECSS